MSLRPLTEKDLSLVRTWRNAPAVCRNMYTKHEITETEHRAWFSRLKDDAQSLWLIHEDSAGQADGVLYFTQLQTGNSSAFMGFYPAPEASPGTGTRMEFEALEKVFSELDLHKVNCEVLTSNEQGISLHKKFGFKEEGLFRDFYFDGQRYWDVARLGIFGNEWAAKREEIRSRIAKLDALVSAKIARGGGESIVILTDQHSWIAPYIDDLAEEWSAAGHDCKIAHNVIDVSANADFCFCLSFSEIVPANVREHFKHTLVVHESDLPAGRGWAPMTWQILSGSKCIPVTLLEAVDSVDAGPIYLQEWIKLDGTELNSEWRRRQAETTQQLCAEWMKQYPEVVNLAREQAGAASHYPRRRPADSQLDLAMPLGDQFDLLRVVDNQNYPAFFEARGKRFELEVRKLEG